MSISKANIPLKSVYDHKGKMVVVIVACTLGMYRPLSQDAV